MLLSMPRRANRCFTYFTFTLIRRPTLLVQDVAILGVSEKNVNTFAEASDGGMNHDPINVHKVARGLGADDDIGSYFNNI